MHQQSKGVKSAPKGVKCGFLGLEKGRHAMLRFSVHGHQMPRGETPFASRCVDLLFWLDAGGRPSDFVG